MAHQQFDDARHSRRALRRFHDALALLDFLHGSEDGERDTKDCVLADLIRMAQSPSSSRMLGTHLLWLALWPGLDALYRRLQRRFTDKPEELVSEIGARFTAALHRADLSRIHRPAATLVCNVERDILRGKKQRWAEQEHHVSLQEGHGSHGNSDLAPRAEPATRGLSELGLPPGLSADEESAALRRVLTGLIGAEADLIVDTVILGESQRELGERLGLTHEAARKRCQRALAHVRRQFRGTTLLSIRPASQPASARVRQARSH